MIVYALVKLSKDYVRLTNPTYRILSIYDNKAEADQAREWEIKNKVNKDEYRILEFDTYKDYKNEYNQTYFWPKR